MVANDLKMTTEHTHAFVITIKNDPNDGEIKKTHADCVSERPVLC